MLAILLRRDHPGKLVDELWGCLREPEWVDAGIQRVRL